jgi:hypothetical protein
LLFLHQKGSERHDLSSSENSDTKSLSARKSLFKSPVPKKSGLLVEGNSSDYILTGMIQKQIVYIKALEKEVTFYRVLISMQSNNFCVTCKQQFDFL